MHENEFSEAEYCFIHAATLRNSGKILVLPDWLFYALKVILLMLVRVMLSTIIKFIALGCIVFLSIGIGASEKYSVMLYEPNNPPYVIFDNADTSGIFLDVFAGIEQHTNLKFEFVYMPIARALHEFDAGNIDIEPGVNPDWRRHMKVLGEYSVAYAISEEVVVFSPGNYKDVKGPGDLLDEIVGIVRGFSYPEYDAAFSSEMIIRINNVSQTNLLQQLLKDRFKQVFVGLNTILYFQKEMPEYRHLQIGSVVDKRDVMMRVHPNQKAILPVLNDALMQMINEGEIQRIYARYR
ncbi:substrate-binding periplasmic protein [Planctobacterium marinum]|uniref:substrate-binding periplasmic protein n=1 Tax=Planctobacterium marinum TaxID=1631968 RepID=UPI0030C6ED38